MVMEQSEETGSNLSLEEAEISDSSENEEVETSICRERHRKLVRENWKRRLIKGD